MSWFSSKDNKNDNYIHAAIQRHHETQRNNYYRREVIRANEERRRKGLPSLPVPPGDWR